MRKKKNLIYFFSRSSNLALPDGFFHSVIQEILTECLLCAGHGAENVMVNEKGRFPDQAVLAGL